jgi:DNA (cytosine-5)-methyltransferase 1
MTPELILRRLTPLECERLMGFPDDHTKFTDDGKIIADTNRYKMCGNAIASPVAQWIGKELKKWLI